jgi:5-hydroxyisourate hydrolase
VNGISTHILDTSLGRPVAGVSVTLEQSGASGWREIAMQTSDDDGRVRQMLPSEWQLQRGPYRLTFQTQDYFDKRGVQGLYPLVQVTFTVTEVADHYHIPLWLAPNGYSTYRGS